jgi:hypothetical protein
VTACALAVACAAAFALVGAAGATVSPAATPTPTPIYPIPTPSPTPTATPTPTPGPSSLLLVIFAVKVPHLHDGALTFTVRCLPHACQVRFKTKIHVPHHGTVRLATVHRQVRANHDKKVTIHVPRAKLRPIRAGLRAHRKVTVHLVGHATDSHNHDASFSLTRRLRRG